jgi:carboxymethylenebutenolidase
MISPSRRLTRRQFLAGSAAAAGYALAARPISAETITTSAEGLVAGEVRIPVDVGEIPAYRAMPVAGTAHPVVLVIHEIFGLHEYIRDVCRRLAQRGHLAVAPDFFARQGDVSGLSSVDKIIGQVVSKVPDAQVLRDLDAAAKWAAAEKGDLTRLAVTGFCWGGRITWLYAAHSAALKAGVAWYGRLAGEESELRPRHPLQIAPLLKAPVLGLFGSEDTGIPLETVERMRAALAKGKSGSEIVVYPGAPHGFHADYRPGYRKEPAKDGWKLMLEWFRRHGAA